MPKLWRHLTANFTLMQIVEKMISCSKKRRKLHENRLINTEDTPTSTNTVRRRAAPASVAWQTKKQTKKLLFFRSPVAVRLSIFTKLCMQIEDVNTIFATDNYFWIWSLVFALRAKNKFLGFLVPKFFFCDSSFMNRILPKLKHGCRPSSSINIVSTATVERKNKSFFVCFFVCHATKAGAARRRTVFVDVGVSSVFINRFSCSLLRFLKSPF